MSPQTQPNPDTPFLYPGAQHRFAFTCDRVSLSAIRQAPPLLPCTNTVSSFRQRVCALLAGRVRIRPQVGGLASGLAPSEGFGVR